MLVTGHPEIDLEHKEMIEGAQVIQSAIKKKDFPAILTSLGSFEDEMKEHFRSEEDLMRAEEIDLLDAHAQLHDKLLQGFILLKDTFIENQSLTFLKKEFKAFMIAMTKHIMNFDIPVFNQIQERAVPLE